MGLSPGPIPPPAAPSIALCSWSAPPQKASSPKVSKRKMLRPWLTSCTAFVAVGSCFGAFPWSSCAATSLNYTIESTAVSTASTPPIMNVVYRFIFAPPARHASAINTDRQLGHRRIVRRVLPVWPQSRVFCAHAHSCGHAQDSWGDSIDQDACAFCNPSFHGLAPKQKSPREIQSRRLASLLNCAGSSSNAPQFLSNVCGTAGWSFRLNRESTYPHFAALTCSDLHFFHCAMFVESEASAAYEDVRITTSDRRIWHRLNRRRATHASCRGVMGNASVSKRSLAE